MKTISDLLEKFSRSLGRDVASKEIAGECIREVCGFTVAPKDVSIKDGILRIKTSPARRSEINLHESGVIALFCERTGQKVSKILYS